MCHISPIFSSFGSCAGVIVLHGERKDMVVVITKSVLLAQFTLDAEGKVAQNNSRNSLQLYGFLAAPTIVPDSERQEGLPPQIAG